MPARPRDKTTTTPLRGKASADTYELRALQTLRTAGLRITRPRQNVVVLLAEGTTPLTAASIHQSLVLQNVHVHPASVYRTLGVLESHGLVERVGDRDGFIRTDRKPGTGTPLHLFCRRCQQVTALALGRAAPWSKLADEHGFRVEHSRVELRGICVGCLGADRSRDAYASD